MEIGYVLVVLIGCVLWVTIGESLAQKQKNNIPTDGGII